MGRACMTGRERKLQRGGEFLLFFHPRHPFPPQRRRHQAIPSSQSPRTRNIRIQLINPAQRFNISNPNSHNRDPNLLPPNTNLHPPDQLPACKQHPLRPYPRQLPRFLPPLRPRLSTPRTRRHTNPDAGFRVQFHRLHRFVRGFQCREERGCGVRHCGLSARGGEA